MSDDATVDVAPGATAPTVERRAPSHRARSADGSHGLHTLQRAIGNRATRILVQRHAGRHPAPDGHTEAEHDAQGHGPPFEPLMTIGDDPSVFVNQIGEVLGAVRTLRGDEQFRSAGVDPSIFRPAGAFVYFEDYIVQTDSTGRLLNVLEQDAANPIMTGEGVVLLREPGTTRLWMLGFSGDRFRARYFQRFGGRPLEGVPEGVSLVLSFASGLELGEERAASMRRRARGQAGDASEAEGWAREAARGAARRRRRRRRRRQRRRRESSSMEAGGAEGGVEGGTGRGVRGAGEGGGGESTTGRGTGTSGTGTGRATDSTASGRGRGGSRSGEGSERPEPLQGPEIIELEVAPSGRQRLRITIEGVRTRVNLRQGESERSLDRRIDRAIDRLQRSRDPNTQGDGVRDGAEETGFQEGQRSGVGGEVPEGERRGPGGGGPGGEEDGGGAAVADEQERIEGASSIANAPAYPARISMAGYQRPARREGEPEPLNISADLNAPTTVRGATNAFTMTLDYAARSAGVTDEVFNRLQSINFYWELIDVTSLNRAEAEQRGRETEVGGGEYQSVDSGTGMDRRRALEEIAADQEADIRMMREENWGWEARAGYLAVIGLSNSVRMIGSLVESYVSIVTTPMNERSIGFAAEGEYLVRCVATPRYDEETLADPDSHVVRASSVAVLPIRVQNLDTRVEEAMSAEERNLERLRQLAEHADTEEEREQARLRLRAAEREANLSGMGAFRSTINGLREQLRLAESLKRAQDDNVPEGQWTLPQIQLALHLSTRRQTVEALVRQVQAQLRAYGGRGADTGTGEHERWVQERRGEFAGQEYRPRIVLASQVNGQVTPVLAMLGELPRRDDDAPPRWRLVDITSPGSHDYYDGEASESGEVGHQEAIRRALREFAENNQYGRGIIAIRLPPQLLQRYGEGITVPQRMVSAPGAGDRALQRLQDLATVAEIAGLFVTGPAGLALGAVGAVAGLAASIDSLARRSRTGHLLEVGTLFDIMGVVGAVAAVGGLGTALGRIHLEDLAATGRRMPSWVTRVERAEGALHIHGLIDNVQQLISIPHQLYEELDRAAQAEPEGERRKQVALALLRAARSGTMTVIQHTGGFVAEPGPRRAESEADPSTRPRRTEPDVAAAEAHADGSGPAIPPTTGPQPHGATTEAETTPPRDEPAGTRRRLEPPSELDVIAEAEARGRSRVAEASRVLYGEGSPPPRTESAGSPGVDRGVESGPDTGTAVPARRPGPPPPPSSALVDLAQGTSEGGPAAQARRAIEHQGDLGAIRRQLEQMTSLPDDRRAEVARHLQDARVAITQEHVTRVLAELQERFPDLDIRVIDLGTQGLASDRDITVRAEPRDPAGYADLSDAERVALDREMMRASLEAVPLLYESLESAGLSPDRALDTNFYTELHEARVEPTDRAEARGIAADQQIVSLTEVLLNTSGPQWRSYVEAQLAMIDGERGTPERMREAMRERFLAQVEAAEASARRLLGGLPAEIDPGDRSGRQDRALREARLRLIEALQRDPPASPRELRRLMADIKLLEPDAYGTRAAVEGVVHGGQAMRRAELHDMLEEGFRRQAEIDGGVGERGPERFDPETRRMEEVSAEEEVQRRRHEAARHVGHRRPGDRDASAFEVNAPRLAAAEAVLGHLLGHVPTGDVEPAHASAAAKNLGRIAALAEESGVRRARGGGLAHLPDIVAAKQASDAPAATAQALQRWAADPSVAAWARTEGRPMRTDLQRLRAFVEWSQRKAHGLVGQMRRRTSAAAFAEEVEVGSTSGAPVGPERATPTTDEPGQRTAPPTASAEAATERTSEAPGASEPPGPHRRGAASGESSQPATLTPAAGGHLPQVAEALAATFDRSAPPPDRYVQAPDWFTYYETWRAADPSRGPSDLPDGPAYYDRRRRTVFLAPEVSAASVAHESLHVLTHDDFHPAVPDWLNEGVTELFTEESMGTRSPDSAYGENVELAHLLHEAVGADVLRAAYFDGAIAPLAAALDAHTGVEGALERLRNLLPSVGTGRADPDLLAAARRLLSGEVARAAGGDRSERPTVPPPQGGRRR